MKNLFPYLTDSEIAEGKQEVIKRLIKTGKFSSKEDANIYIEYVLTRMLDNKYRVRFISVFQNIEKKGIALKRGMTYKIYNEMNCQVSILFFFSDSNYKKNPLRFAVHNAKEVFNATPYNSKLTITN